MKKIFMALLYMISLFLVLGSLSCSASANEPFSGDAAQTSAIAEKSAENALSEDSTFTEHTPVQILATEITYDFSDIELPLYAKDMIGFENSNWGDSIENTLDKLVVSNKTASTIRIIDYSANFAGLPFVAEYLFFSDGRSDIKLAGGVYKRDGYIDVFKPELTMQKAIEDYNKVLAYLKETYGAPAQSFIDIDGSSHIDVTDNINNYLELKAREATALWIFKGEKGDRPALVLNLNSKGQLYINYLSEYIGAK